MGLLGDRHSHWQYCIGKHCYAIVISCITSCTKKLALLPDYIIITSCTMYNKALLPGLYHEYAVHHRKVMGRLTHGWLLFDHHSTKLLQDQVLSLETRGNSRHSEPDWHTQHCFRRPLHPLMPTAHATADRSLPKHFFPLLRSGAREATVATSSSYTVSI